jgi:hypothetical protein
MVATRVFLAGVILLFLGIQLRAVQTFVLNEQATAIVNRRLSRAMASRDSFSAAAYDPYLDDGTGFASLESKRSLTPPRWLGWKLISIGAVLVITYPCFRR